MAHGELDMSTHIYLKKRKFFVFSKRYTVAEISIDKSPLTQYDGMGKGVKRPADFL